MVNRSTCTTDQPGHSFLVDNHHSAVGVKVHQFFGHCAWVMRWSVPSLDADETIASPAVHSSLFLCQLPSAAKCAAAHAFFQQVQHSFTVAISFGESAWSQLNAMVDYYEFSREQNDAVGMAAAVSGLAQVVQTAEASESVPVSVRAVEILEVHGTAPPISKLPGTPPAYCLAMTP